MQTAILVLTALLITQESDPKDEAKKLMNRGNQAYALADYESAIRDFTAAYEKYPSPKILLNLAEAYRAIESWAQAVSHYERFLNEASGTEENVEQVQERVREIEANVGRIEFDAGDDVEITVDEEEITGTKIAVDPGKHLVTARQAGYHDFVRGVDVDAGETEIVEIRLEPLVAPPPPPKLVEVETEQEDDADTPVTEKWWFWTLTGVVVVAVAGAIVAVSLNTGGDDFVPMGELGTGSSADWERF
jgi:hypothetical protein